VDKKKVVRSSDLLAAFSSRVKTIPATQTLDARAEFKARVTPKLKEQTTLRSDALARVVKLKLR
jgi:hypothetical protein